MSPVTYIGRVLFLLFVAALSPMSVGAEQHKVRHAPSDPIPSCIIQAGGPYAVDEHMMKGAFIHVGEIYHFGSLAIRVNSWDYQRGYLVDIKASDYDGAGWRIPANSGPANFKACGKDVSVAIINVAGYGDAFTVGTF